MANVKETKMTDKETAEMLWNLLAPPGTPLDIAEQSSLEDQVKALIASDIAQLDWHAAHDTIN
jgi:hypothetical protein